MNSFLTATKVVVMSGLGKQLSIWQSFFFPYQTRFFKNMQHGNIIRENLCRKAKEPLPLRQIGELGQQRSVWLFA